jgi:hypothetical protein
VAAVGAIKEFPMTASLRRVRRSSAVAIVIGVIAAVCGTTAPAAQAFYIQTHESITRQALPPDQVSPLGYAQILNGPPPGGGAMGSDAFATDEWRHLDNAKNPVEICARAQQAWNILMPVILNGAQPAGPGATVLVNGPAARAAFGGLAHAQQDFYAHSNWVEGNVAAGQPNRLAPNIFPTCNPADFPVDLHTGYFNLLYSKQFPLDGCPPGGPPPGFPECHSVLNKDGPNTARRSAGSRDEPDVLRRRGEPGHDGHHEPVRAGARPGRQRRRREESRCRRAVRCDEAVQTRSVRALRRCAATLSGYAWRSPCPLPPPAVSERHHVEVRRPGLRAGPPGRRARCRPDGSRFVAHRGSFLDSPVEDNDSRRRGNSSTRTPRAAAYTLKRNSTALPRG